MKRSQARTFINDLITMRTKADDSIASQTENVYPTLKGEGALISVGTRINWNGAIKRATVDLWDTIENNPNNAPTLWEDIDYREGYRIIPKTLTVGTAFAKGECGWWGDTLYKSLLDSNVWTPEDYPSGWEIIK